MNDHERPTALSQLIAAERASQAAPADAERNWAAIERRLVDGPPPPDLGGIGGGAASPIVKWIGGLVLVGGVIGGALHFGGGGGGHDGEPIAAASGAAEPVDAPGIVDASGTGAVGEAVAPTDVAPTDADDADDADTDATADADASAGPIADSNAATIEDVSKDMSKETPKKRGRGGHARPPAADPIPTPAPLGLDDELRLIARIRGALRRGDPAGALTLIGEHRRLFADGALVQERSASEAMALCASGRAAEGAAAAAEFRRRWPDSPHRAAITDACGE